MSIENIEHALKENIERNLANKHQAISLEDQTKQLSLNQINVTIKNETLFDENVFAKIKIDKLFFKYEKLTFVKNEGTGECHFDIGNNMIVRSLRRDDFEKKYMDLLAQLTVAGDVTKEKFEQRYDEMKANYNSYFICVVENLEVKKVVASVTLVYERKFFRNTSARGRIEDVVVDIDYRGKSLSRLLLDLTRQMSQLLGCYKLSLECEDELKPFYQKFGFVLEAKQNYLCQRF